MIISTFFKESNDKYTVAPFDIAHLTMSSVAKQPITFKIAVITFKALHGAAPSFITDLIKPYTPGRLLRSSNQFLLSTSKFNLKTYGGWSFTIAAPSVWNALPFELRSCNSPSSFKSKLKTWLFKIGYDVVV